MSQQEQGLATAVSIILAILAAVAFGPWLMMILLAWIFEPRTGSWGAWPHIVGIGWFVLWVGFWVYSRFRG